VLASTRDDYFGIASCCLKKGIEVIRSSLIGNPKCQLIESIEKEDDASLLEHVAEAAGREVLDFFLREVLGQERIQVTSLLQRTHLEENWNKATVLLSQSAGQFMQ